MKKVFTQYEPYEAPAMEEIVVCYEGGFLQQSTGTGEGGGNGGEIGG